MAERSVRMMLVLVLFLCVLIVICQPPFLQLKISYGLSPSVKEGLSQTLGRAIDLYTQKEPYGGKGSNQSSDAFAPQEEVVLCAYVTYSEDPVANKIVYFEIHGPSNPLEEISFVRTATTDGGGLATVSFRIPWPAENAETIVFGTWSVVATVEIAEETVTDTLTFEVGWIVEIVKVETVDVNNLSKMNFTKGERMYFRLTVKNIAMVEKVATLTLDVYDDLEVLLGVVIREDVKIPPGVTVYFIEDLLIPTSAFVGVGVVYANAYDVLGASWCPQASTTFWITRLIVRDVAVISVEPSATEVFASHVVNVTVVVRNEGEITETFDVSAYYDSVFIGTLPVFSLPPGMNGTLTLGWSTSCVPEGVYTLSAVASTVPGETDVEDNTFVDGTVRVKSPHVPPIARDVAVISVEPSATDVVTCHVVNVTVVVTNEGNATETFDVSARYDSVFIGTLPVISLPPGMERTLTFGWSTSCVPEGVYTLSAVASTVPGETDVEDNTFVDGTVRVKSPNAPVVSELPAWLMWLPIILTILAAASLFTSTALLFCLRKKKGNSPAKVVAPVTYREKTHKTCIECGREFLGVRAFCPNCFTYNG